MKKPPHKSKLVAVRFTPDQVRDLKKRAAALGKEVSEYLRDLAQRDLEQSRSKAA